MSAVEGEPTANPTCGRLPQPALVLVSEHYAALLLDGRDRRDYDVQGAGSAIEAIAVLSRFRNEG